LALRQLNGGGSNGIVRCRNAHDTTAGLDDIKRRLVVRRGLPCTDEGDGLLSSRSRPTGHNGETVPERGEQPTKRLAYPPGTNKRNVITSNERLHTVSPGTEPTWAPYCAWPARQGQAHFTVLLANSGHVVAERHAG
jgi:hypothetical protein